MNWLCRLIGHRWQYHGLPDDRRRCVTCLYKEWLIDGEWKVKP